MSEERRRLLDGAIAYVKIKQGLELEDWELQAALLAVQSTDTADEWINRMFDVLTKEQRRRQRMNRGTSGRPKR